MRLSCLCLLLALRAVGLGAGVGVHIPAPAGWPVWSKSPVQEVYQAPDPEIEEGLLRVYRTPSFSLRTTLASELREVVRGRTLLRVSPEHHGTTGDGLAFVAQAAISDDGQGGRRHTFLAVVQGVRVAILLHFESSTAELLSQHFATLMATTAAIRFPG